MDRRLLTRSGVYLSTQQQLKLPRGVHCLALPVVVGEGHRLPGKRQQIESGQADGQAHRLRLDSSIPMP